jgi:arginase family enzyme
MPPASVTASPANATGRPATRTRDSPGYNLDMAVDLFEELDIVDVGDVFVIPSNIEKTFDQIERAAEAALEIASRDTEAIFLSLDIDVVDPGNAPGTGTPEPGVPTLRLERHHLAARLPFHPRRPGRPCRRGEAGTPSAVRSL